MNSETPRAVLERVIRSDWGRLTAALMRHLRDLQLTEDCLQEACTSAIDHWQRGIPNNPQGWLMQVARRRAIDRLRRAARLRARTADIQTLMEMDQADSAAEAAQDIPDERLRLIFTACHPALEPKTRVALTLRTLCGLSTSQIARAYLDREEAMAQRLVRARRKIAAAGIAYEVPDADQWDDRLNSVLTVIYLIFNAGYSGAPEMETEAMRLCALLEELRPGLEEVEGLGALMLLSRARAPARIGANGTLIPLEEQDRSLWDARLAEVGRRRVTKALRRGHPGPFQLQAAIAAIHSEAGRFDQTGWAEIVLIYDRLIQMSNNPVLRLNRAAAFSYLAGPAAALAQIEPLAKALGDYQSFHAARADFLYRLEQYQAAGAAYARALSLSTYPPEQRFLQARFDRAKKEAEQSSAQVQQGG